MCKFSVLIVAAKRQSLKDEPDYIREKKRQILVPENKEVKLDVVFLGDNGAINLESKKGSYFIKVIFDFGGQRGEKEIISKIKKSLTRLNKTKDPVYFRVSDDHQDFGCTNIKKIGDILDKKVYVSLPTASVFVDAHC